ncbi:carboxymuconolactone decarboxylase family protein [Bradyrhizobium sp. HKCCYLS1011]|uniref:carboxymuconolactone decarboxylase family protein n=1 Tax=Bradyrhizobium sp. HKCCYLS1011 TaxID=3420733 RepID=UPI003EB747D6
MSLYPVHTVDNAPEASRFSLKAIQSAFGFIPNIAGAMATSPVLIESLVGLFGHVHGGSFTEPQIQVLLLTNAVTNGAEWAVAFHSALAREQGVAAADVEAIRARRAPAEPKLAALSLLARTLIETRGKLDQRDIEAFLEAGFTPAHLLEVIAVSAASTITNYTSNVTRPPLEARFGDHRWHAA